MSESARTRLIGIALLGVSLPFAFWVEVDGGLGKIVGFAAGALLGFSLLLVLTGKRLWSTDTWGGRHSPVER